MDDLTNLIAPGDFEAEKMNRMAQAVGDKLVENLNHEMRFRDTSHIEGKLRTMEESQVPELLKLIKESNM